LKSFEARKVRAGSESNITEYKKRKVNPSAIEKNSIRSKLEDEKRTESLHPSWEAKLKMKPLIAEFKGKKIEFDED